LFHIQSPIVVFSVAKDSLHIFERVLVQPSYPRGKTLVPRPSNFNVILAPDTLFIIFWIVVLDEVVELICLRAVTRPAVRALVGYIFIIVGENICETASFIAAIFVSMSALETLELGLTGVSMLTKT
jgi:hypothetical protein